MNIEYKTPIVMRVVTNPDGFTSIKGSIPMNIFMESEMNIAEFQGEIRFIENMYLDLVDDIISSLKDIRGKGNTDNNVLLYWVIGEKILRFSEIVDNSQFYIHKFLENLSRDTQYSETMLRRCVRFFKIYHDLEMIDESRTFESYIIEFEGGYISSRRKEKRKELGLMETIE